MYVCIYIYIYTHTCMCIYIYIYMYIHMILVLHLSHMARHQRAGRSVMVYNIVLHYYIV